MSKLEDQIRRGLTLDLISSAESFFKKESISTGKVKAEMRHRYFDVLKRIYVGDSMDHLCGEMNIGRTTMFEMVKATKNRVEIYKRISSGDVNISVP
jgi:hypothetical protein